MRTSAPPSSLLWAACVVAGRDQRRHRNLHGAHRRHGIANGAGPDDKIAFDAGKRAVLDAGEWTSSVGRKREEDGTEKLVSTSAAWLGWPELVRESQDGKVRLWFQDGQRKVVFERVSEPK